jgi:hypothetical protein
MSSMASSSAPVAPPDAGSKGSLLPRRMNPTEIEFALRDLVALPYDADTFAYNLIAIFNASKMTVSRLKSGTTNKATQPGDVLWQKNLFFRPATPGEDVGAIADALLGEPLTAKHKPRFNLVTNGQQVHIRDLKFDETVNVEFERLDEQSYVLLPLAGYERRAIIEEHPADIKAAKKLKKLYDAILAANPTWNSGHHSHELNLLMTRLLFCFYAEDTGIFDTPQIFTNTATQHTSEDGDNVAALLDRLFRIMNIEDAARRPSTPAVDAKFPYVNGSLFEETVELPNFSRTARRQLLECGDLDWTTITPDIFGSMIQTIAQGATRSDLGMHYTSVPNIMKVLQPLFLDNLHSDYEKARESVPKLEALLGRLSNIRVFDPACGSGNFLVIAYKALRQLEMEILKRIEEIAPHAPLRLSNISIQAFFGADLVDFACETAKLSLWIAEHQMNRVFTDIFGSARPALPLAKISTIVNANSVEADWFALCPPHLERETFICGNPPYAGKAKQTPEQKRDIISTFSPVTRAYKTVDYVGCFLIKVASYVAATNSRSALVTTNSMCQGEQVPVVWPLIFGNSVEITFAHTTFKWENNASHNAGVSCIIIGLARSGSVKDKQLITDGMSKRVSAIGPYLIPNNMTIVSKRHTPLSNLPHMNFGSMANDGGHLICTKTEYDAIVRVFPASKLLFRRYFGADEVINDVERWCLWIQDDSLAYAKTIRPIADRIAQVAVARLKSKRPKTNEDARRPHKFAEIRYQDAPALVMPEVSSEQRIYLQTQLLNRGDIASNKLYVVYNPPPFLFALLSSRLHYIWAETVGGNLETRLQYSTGLVYNTFPVPTLSTTQRSTLADRSRSILRARARHPGKALSWLYNPKTMPAELAESHRENDIYVEEHIFGKHFNDDLQRQEHLFVTFENLRKGAASNELAFDTSEVATRG